MPADPPAAPPGFHHCSACGGRLTQHVRGDRLRPRCTDCGRTVFHNPAVGVAVVCVDGQGRVLLARRARSYAGQWCIPCGYVEWDEEVRSAALRELEEETGLSAELGGIFAVHSNFHDPTQHTVGIWFRATAWSGELRPADDVDLVGFYHPHELPGPLAFPTDELVIAELRRELDYPTAGTPAAQS